MGQTTLEASVTKVGLENIDPAPKPKRTRKPRVKNVPFTAFENTEMVPDNVDGAPQKKKRGPRVRKVSISVEGHVERGQTVAGEENVPKPRKPRQRRALLMAIGDGTLEPTVTTPKPKRARKPRGSKAAEQEVYLPLTQQTPMPETETPDALEPPPPTEATSPRRKLSAPLT